VNSVGPHPAHVLAATAWPKAQKGPADLAARARRERTSTVAACGALALAQPSTAARPARGDGVGEVSTRGLRERRAARFRGGVLIGATTH
jgi:hypothetical protein